MKALGLLMFLIVKAIADIHQPYLQPHEGVQRLQQIHDTVSTLNDEDWKRVTEVLHLITPQQVLQQYRYGNISDTCSEQVVFLLEALVGETADNSWAINLLDSWGKPHAGLRRLAFTWLGNFDECRQVKSNVTGVDLSIHPVQFDGKYCIVGAKVGIANINVIPATGLSIGGCFPSGCSESDIHVMVTALLGNTTASVDCQETQLPLSDAAIVTIVLYSLVALLCLLGTLYDFWYIMTGVEVKTVKDGAVVIEREDDVEVLVEPAVDEPMPRKPGAVGELLMCFSLYTNGYKLLGTEQAPGTIKCLHGLRFISMSWVILGHTAIFSLTSVSNFLTVYDWFTLWTFQVILNAGVSVDTFFVISGLLTTFLLLKDFEKKKPGTLKFLISVPVLYLHRYIRLTPAYGFMILYYACLSLYMYNSPLKPTHTSIADVNCVNHWWTNLLYVNNIVHPLEECAAWTWYLSNDFQFFLVTPFVVYLMYILPIPGVVLSTVMILTSAVTATVITVKDDLGISSFASRDPSHLDPQELVKVNEDYYYAPWARYQSYGIGVTFGFILYHCKGKLPIHRPINLTLWAVCAAVMLATIYGPLHLEDRSRVTSTAEAAIYNGWARTGWSLCVGYIILACSTGRGGWVNEFLSWSGFIPLSKMTYCAYLVHPVIMTIISVSHRSKVIWNEITYIYMFAAYLTLSYSVAFVFSLMFEIPFMHLDRKYLTGKLKKS